MAHFSLENEINEATTLDTPLKKGPLARWQRKALEVGMKSLSLEGGLNVSGLAGSRCTSVSSTVSNKTPKTPISSRILTDKVFQGQTPKTPGSNWCKTPGKSIGKTPGKTPSKKKGLSTKTPSKSAPSTPHSKQDRFIPNRSTMDLETGHYILSHADSMTTTEDGDASPEEHKYSTKMTRAFSEGNILSNPTEHKILSFIQKAPTAKEGYINNLKVLYNGGRSTNTQQVATVSRHILHQPDRIMDAPEMIDDYYLNLLSWSSNNHLAVALGCSVYLWNAGDGSITQLPITENSDVFITSLSWVKEGNYLGIGTSIGNVQLWDVGQQKLLRTMPGHVARVGSLSWSNYILTSGCRSGAIHHHDVRVADHHVGTLQNHTQEVCGLSWSPDGRLLASGANDNLVNIWDSTVSHQSTPLHTFTEHQAAVKAIAWCPWQSSLLATGGGTADRHIRFWNVTSGTCINNVDTNSQVCAIKWSTEYKELISGHGFSQNQLTIWKYPSLARVANLIGHQSRVLCLAMSPDGTTVASAAADETIRLWKCFAVDKQAKTTKSQTSSKQQSGSVLMKGIR